MRTLFPVALTGALAGSLALLGGTQQEAPFQRAPDALERVTWRTRTLVSDDRLTNWNFAIPGPGLTFLDTVVRADAAVVTFVEASSTQAVGGGDTRTLDSSFTAEEIASLKNAWEKYACSLTVSKAAPPVSRWRKRCSLRATWERRP